jgi:outer membrane protein OmpU
MNNLKKIGLSALAGSLAMVSANAVEYTMSGEIASSFQTGKGATTSEATNGKGFGTETDLTFTAAGELDNGFTVDMLMGVNTAAALSNSSSQVTLGMGSLGAIRLNHIGGSSANAIDDVMPNAYQETWDGLADGSNPSFFGDMNGSGSIEYRTPAVEYSGVTISGSLLYDPNSGALSTAAAPKGGANGVRGTGTSNISGTSATIKIAHASGLEIGGGVEQADDDQGLIGVMGNTSQQTGYVKYTMGPLSIGYQEAYNNNRHSTGNVGRDESATFTGIAYTAGDLTVSYGESTLEAAAISTTAATEEELESFQAAYTMGAMTISAAISEMDQVGGVAGTTYETNTLAVSFAF